MASHSRRFAEFCGWDQAIRNLLDGQALIATAEGADTQIENILPHMREIAVQSANDPNNAQDRTTLRTELDAMIREIDQSAGTAK